jgi:hypothetical protein
MPEFLKPWRMALPTIALVLLGLIWSGYWMWASSQAQHAVAQWRSELAGEGITVACGGESWGGYPFRVQMKCKPGKIASQNGSAEFTELTVMAQAYDLGHILFLNDGDTILTSALGQITITQDGAMASLILSPKGTWQLDVELTKAKADEFSAQRVAFHARMKADSAERVLEIAAVIEAAEIKTDAAPIALESISASGSIAPVPEVITYETLSREASLLTIGQIDMQSAAIRYQASGSVMIGADARPQGSLKGRIQNLDHVLQALADRGILEENARMGAGVVLGLLGGNSPEGMRIDIAADQGGLYVGPFRIGELPALF